jgi:MFS family permease
VSTSQSHSHSLEGNAQGTVSSRKVAISSSIGATIEAYDFIGYGTAAALYFSHDFFPSGDPLTGTLLSFATLGVGFAVRPLGGVIGGYLGDKLGRKPVLVASLMLMGLATFFIGLLPTYQTLGIWAGILLVLVRVVQGLAYGAEWGGAILMTYEHAPWGSKGKFTGIVQSGFPVGLLLANLVFLVSVHLPGTWAWRVPFLLSIVLVVVGLIIRSKVPESPVFEEVKARGEIVKNPITQVIREDWRNILRGIGLRVAETAGYAVAITFMLSYLKTEKLADNTLTLVAICVASAIGIFATYNWGKATDRVGRRPIYLFGTLVMVIFAFPMFLLVNTGIAVLIVLAVVIAYAVCQNSLAGAQGAWFPELFNANTRASGASLAYQFSAVVSGFTPFVVTLLYANWGWVGAAALFALYGLIGLIATLVTKETFGPVERTAAATDDQSMRVNA